MAAPLRKLCPGLPSNAKEPIPFSLNLNPFSPRRRSPFHLSLTSIFRHRSVACRPSFIDIQHTDTLFFTWSTDFLPPSQRETQVKPPSFRASTAHRHVHGLGGLHSHSSRSITQLFLHSTLLIPEHCASNSLAHNASQSLCWSPASPRQHGKKTGRSRDRCTICLQDSCEDL